MVLIYFYFSVDNLKSELTSSRMLQAVTFTSVYSKSQTSIQILFEFVLGFVISIQLSMKISFKAYLDQSCILRMCILIYASRRWLTPSFLLTVYKRETSVWKALFIRMTLHYIWLGYFRPFNDWKVFTTLGLCKLPSWE